MFVCQSANIGIKVPSRQIDYWITNRNEAVAIKFDKERPNYSNSDPM